jgi:hypothetical protein
MTHSFAQKAIENEGETESASRISPGVLRGLIFPDCGYGCAGVFARPQTREIGCYGVHYYVWKP